MKNRTIRLLLLHIVVLSILGILVLKYTEEIQAFKEILYQFIHPQQSFDVTVSSTDLLPVETTGDEWFADAPLIRHAGGEVDGNTYTNSREAVLHYLEEGDRFIEIDLAFTKDGHLVCVHRWSDIYATSYHPTLDQFIDSKIQGKFSPLTAQGLLEIMQEYPDMRIVTDLKSSEDLCAAISTLVDLADRRSDILERFIIQLYTGREKSEIQSIYPFADEQFLLTTYQWGTWNLYAAKVCNEENISVITAPYGNIPDEDVALLRQLGFTLYEHTVNRVDEAQQSISRGISGFYSDNLSKEDFS